MRNSIIWVIVLLLLTGCFKRPWTPTLHSEQIINSQNVSLTLPDDWMLSGRDDLLLVTRDGVLLQNIIVATISVDDELKYTKKRFRRGMSPLEQAEVYLDNMASSPNHTAFKVHGKQPAKVAGHQAFRAEYSLKDDDGLVYRGILYGFMQNNWFYVVRYVAPERHYFPRDKEQFEQVVQSIKLLV